MSDMCTSAETKAVAKFAQNFDYGSALGWSFSSNAQFRHEGNGAIDPQSDQRREGQVKRMGQPERYRI